MKFIKNPMMIIGIINLKKKGGGGLFGTQWVKGYSLINPMDLE